MAWTTPVTVAPGDAILSSLWNEQVRDNSAAIRDAQVNVVGRINTSTATQSVAAGSSWVIPWDGSTTVLPFATSAASSKVLLIANISVTGESGFPGNAVFFTAGGTRIGVGASPGNRRAVTSTTGDTEEPSRSPTIPMMFLYSPGTTSSVDYDVRLQSTSTITRTFYLNRGLTDSDANTAARAISTFTAIEVPV